MFHKYTNIEADVEVIRLSPETSAEVTTILVNEAARELLASLSIVYNATLECNEFVYRYRSETRNQTLNVGDYLVKLNTGLLRAYTPKDFEGDYKHNAACEEGELTVTKSVLAALQERYGVTDIKDIASKLTEVYDETNNTLVVNFTNLALVDPTGVGSVLKAIFDSGKIPATATYVLNFNNTSDENRNRFDLTGLQLIIGEINTCENAQRRSIVGLTFIGENMATSAVSSVVSEDDWVDYIEDVRRATGIKRNSAIKR